ncbi:hypothetical protein ACAG26_20860 [Mycobacterium sp. pUA109]|uniref:hypothetical protein n=1 Tax=Mycobacterium sp. pUA109 TaxID=3238982 RepID=UPI00351BBBFC
MSEDEPGGLTETQIRSSDPQLTLNVINTFPQAAQRMADHGDAYEGAVRAPAWEGATAGAVITTAGRHNATIADDKETINALHRRAVAAMDPVIRSRTAVLDLIDDTRKGNQFTVSDDLKVTAADLEYKPAAEQKEMQIRQAAQKWADAETNAASEIRAGAQPLTGRGSQQPGDGRNGRIVLVDDRRGDRDGRHPDGRNRNPDDRDGAEVRDDEQYRRPEGGKGDGTDWLDSDWAGRAILERYLLGGGRDWDIKDDPTWSQYMMNNPNLARQLDGRVRDQAQQGLNAYRNGGVSDIPYSSQFHADTQNGESITGYQYLNGTNADAGDFKINGTTHIEQLPGGGYKVTVNDGYQWNDIIDPNLKYDTDKFKDRIAQIITLGQAQPYPIHIGWHSQSEFIYDQDGTLVNAKGYPYK